MITIHAWASLALITVVLVGVALGRYPGLLMNRATIALTGGVALVAIGALTLEDGFATLDLNTLSLLFAMMVLNAHLRRAGFFHTVSRGVLRLAHTPRQLLALVIAAAGVLSALFLNDTIVLMFTPLVLDVVGALRRNPLPYLMGLATAANIGSVATITGNPQNMLIGTSSQISFLTFSAALTPVAVVGMALSWLVLILIYRTEFGTNGLPELEIEEEARTVDRPLLYKSVTVTVLLMGAFVAGVPIALAALSAASLLLVTRQVDAESIFADVDWSLLVFFSGLFMVTGAIEHSGWSGRLFAATQPLLTGGDVPLAAVAVVLSNLVSNVPAVMLFRPVVPQLPDPQHVWLLLAMATTLAGNLTLLGSVANLIVAELAHSRQVELSFAEYLKAGPLITLLTLIWGVAWLGWMG